MSIEIKKFQFCVEVHIDRKESEDFKACQKIYTLTPDEWEELKARMSDKPQMFKNGAWVPIEEVAG